MNKIFYITVLLICRTMAVEFKARCDSDATCTSLYNSAYQCINNACEHQSVLLTDPFQMIGLLIIILISALSSAVGNGGGAMLMPVYILAFNFPIGNAVPLSKVTIFAAAFFNIIMIFNKRRAEDQDRFIIDYRIGTFIVPLILAGTMIGVTIMMILPPIIIFGPLIIYLVMTLKSCYNKWKMLYTKETEEKEQSSGIEASITNELVIDNNNSATKDDIKPQVIETDTMMAQGSKKSFFTLIAPLKTNLLLVLGSSLVVLLSSLIKGGKGVQSIAGIDQYSALGWLVLGGAQIICFISSIIIYNREKHAMSHINELDTPTSIFMKKLTVKSYIGGILAGSLGIGGGMVIGPVLLNLNMQPKVAAAISGFVVLFTSMSTSLQFFIAGAFESRFVFYFMTTSAIGSIIGNMIISKLMVKYKRESFLVFLLLILFLCSTITLTSIGITQIIKQSHTFKFSLPYSEIPK